MNRSQHFVESLLEESQRKVRVQNKTIQRLDESLQSVSYELARTKRDYDKVYQVLKQLHIEYEGIPKWIRKFCKWRTT